MLEPKKLLALEFIIFYTVLSVMISTIQPTEDRITNCYDKYGYIIVGEQCIDEGLSYEEASQTKEIMRTGRIIITGLFAIYLIFVVRKELKKYYD